MSAMSEMPNVEEEGLELAPVPGVPGRYRFAGTGEAEGAAVLDRFLGQLHTKTLARELREVTLELTELEFINSSCLKAMVAWEECKADALAGAMEQLSLNQPYAEIEFASRF